MDWKRLAKRLARAGSMADIGEVEKRLGISRDTAINYIYELRKRGLVETERGRKGNRLYRITPTGRKEKGYPGLYETINRYSPIKLVEPFRHRIHDHELTPEEAIVRAILTKDFRTILASLALFRKVADCA
jgi:DNA-binding MarR family transcriptional regulator